MDYKTVLASTSSKTKSQDNELKKLLNEIEQKYSQPKTSILGLEKLKTEQKSDNELRNDAETLLKSKFLENRQKTENEINTKSSGLESKKTSLESSYKNILNEIDEAYNTRKASAENDALKRGLARSSVITSQIQNFDQGRISDKNNALQVLSNANAEIEQEIAGLNEQRKSALANFEITEAAEIDKKLHELKKEREQNLNDITKYNNTIQEKEAKQQLSMSDAKDLATLELNKQKEKVDLILNYYSKLDKDSAIKDFAENGGFKEHLGSYYTYMLNYLSNR